MRLPCRQVIFNTMSNFRHFVYNNERGKFQITSHEQTAMTKTLDRRVRRSRRLLADALLELIVEKGYDAVTIQEVADRADLNRATFYLHFDGKEDLLVAGLEERFDELVATMNLVAAGEPVWENPAHDLLLFRHVAEHAPVYKALLGDRGLGWVMHRVIGYIAREVERELAHDVPGGRGSLRPCRSSPTSPPALSLGLLPGGWPMTCPTAPRRWRASPTGCVYMG